jgi:hypothetical protein
MKNFACAKSLLTLAGATLAGATLVGATLAGAALAKEPIPPPDFAADFAVVDVSHDGKLTWEEFLTGRKEREGLKHGEDARKPSYKWLLHYVVRFSQMDLDDDEALNVDEYKKGRLLNNNYDGTLRYIQPKLAAEPAPNVLRAMAERGHPQITPAPDFSPDFASSDRNHDSKLTWDEFSAGRESREGKPGSGVDGTPLDYHWARHYVERFQAMDVNDDEVLSKAEYTKGRLLNTYNDGTLRFIQPKPGAKKPKN